MTFNGFFEMEDDDFYDDILCNFPKENSDSMKHKLDAGEAVSKASEIKPAEGSSIDQESNGLSPIPSEKKRGGPSGISKSFDISITNSVSSIEKNSFLNNRFVPGFIAKRRKRIFDGPAGLILDPEISFRNVKSNQPVKEHDGTDIDIQNIINFHFEDDDLLLPSWEHLQKDVFASEDLLSLAKYYSIHRVFHETKTIKLPKHIVVPALCVLLKTFNHAESPSVFIDDTGMISGKIDKTVLSLFEEHLKDGVALILKEVTFLCNMLLLTKQSLVSIYLEDGTVKQVQRMDSVPLMEAPLKSMSCACPGTPKAFGNKTVFKNSCASPINPQKYNHKQNNSAVSNNAVTKVLSSNRRISNTPIRRISRCSSPNMFASPKQRFLSNSKYATDVLDRVHDVDHIRDSAVVSSSRNEKFDAVSNHVSGMQNNMSNRQNKTVMNNSISETSEMRSDNPVQTNEKVKNETKFFFVESSGVNDMFGGNSEMDEFDELLGSLDESSFLEEM